MSSTTTTTGCGCSSAPTLAGAQLGGTATRRPAHLAGPAPQLGADWWDSAKGEIMTQALALSGYATDPNALRVYYRDNKDVIDAYLDYIDVADVARELGSSAPGQIDWFTLGLGFAGGVGATLLYLRYFNQQED